MPGKIGVSAVIVFAVRSDLKVTPFRAAIPTRKSPLLTMYSPLVTETVAGAAAAGTTVTVSTGSLPPTGTASLSPGWIELVMLNLLTISRSVTLTLNLTAMPTR